MNTRQRAVALSQAAESFPLLGKIAPEDLIDVVRLELGHAEILDGFRPYAGRFSQAFPQDPILHIISGNTPHAGLQSLIRGLLLDAINFVKLPEHGLQEVEEFAEMLPPLLRDRVHLSAGLPDEWLRKSKTWIAFGTDETIAQLQGRLPRGVTFESHPHRISLGIVFDDSRGDAASLAAADVARFNQKGCLSPHDIYVVGDARSYAARLAQELADWERMDPRGPLTPAEAAEITDLRSNYRFQAANGSAVSTWESEYSTAWTVIYEEDPRFSSSCLNRVAFVKPLPADLRSALGSALPWIAAVGIWPVTPQNAKIVTVLEPSRICALGQMQNPPFCWHQEGRQTLAPLARWVDFEPPVG